MEAVISPFDPDPDISSHPTDTLNAAIGGSDGYLRLTYEGLSALCRGDTPCGCIVTPSVQCTLWLHRGTGWPSSRPSAPDKAIWQPMSPGDVLSVEPVGGHKGTVRVVAVLSGSPSPVF
jgi:hypothetical protein